MVGRLNEEKGNQHDSQMVRKIQLWRWASWLERSADSQSEESTDEEEKGGIQRLTPDGKHGGDGSIHDWQRVKSQFLEGL
jgi:hypothetical protein